MAVLLLPGIASDGIAYEPALRSCPEQDRSAGRQNRGSVYLTELPNEHKAAEVTEAGRRILDRS